MLEGGDFCSTIPKLTASAHAVDGSGDELCDVKAFKLDATTAALTLGTVPTPAPTTAWGRIAWSATGLHLHFRVTQANVVVGSPPEAIFNGDGIEVFAKGDAQLTGAFNGTSDPGAVHLVVTPPSADGSQAARAELFRGAETFPAPDVYASRIVTNGYEVELVLPWSLIRPNAPAPTSGDQIAVDWGVDYHVRTEPPSPGWQFQLLAAFESVAGSSPCGGNLHPSCDDRTWCTPTLE